MPGHQKELYVGHGALLVTVELDISFLYKCLLLRHGDSLPTEVQESLSQQQSSQPLILSQPPQCQALHQCLDISSKNLVKEHL